MSVSRQSHEQPAIQEPANAPYFLLFLLSGMSGLMYEIIWVRQFTLIFGASTYAVTIVLATFMFGLGLGSWLVGKMADVLDKKKLLRTYIFIEIGIAIYSLLLPFLLSRAQSLYIGFFQLTQPNPLVFNGYKLILSFFLLAVPTILMGATLPVISRYLIKEKAAIALSVSQLYAANSFGAILGTLLTGYFLLPHIGIRLTNFTAAGINFMVAGGFWFISSAIGPATKSADHQAQPAASKGFENATWLHRSVIWGFFLSGAAAMFYEVAWTRTLSMILGTTTYAFSTMLAAFLVGIVLGSALYRFIPQRIPRISLFIHLQVMVGLSVLLVIPAFEKMPFIFLSLQSKWAQSWFDLQFLRFFLAMMIMIIPTTAMGALFPIVSALLIRDTAHLGRYLGKAMALNTFGNAIGAAMAGLLLIPLIGLERCIMAGAFLNMTAALMVHFTRDNLSIRRRLLVSAGLCALFMVPSLVITPWAPRIMNSGPYVYADRYERLLTRYRKASQTEASIPAMPAWRIWELAMKQYELLYYRSGITATVAVMQRPDGVRFLTIDGKTDASTGTKSDMRTQVMIGQLPLLFHPNAGKVLVVGLGSGVTAGSVLTHPKVQVDCAEISPAVIEAAGLFSQANHDVLNSPRLNVIARDARNLLLTSSKDYDVIISQPSNPWISGESNLFSLDWYRLVHDHLKSGGLFLQWVPSYLIAEPDLKVIMHTLRSVFPNLTVWTSGSVGDLVLLAKKGAPLTVDYRLLKKKAQINAVWTDITRIGLDPLLVPLRLLIMNPEQLGIYLYSQSDGTLTKNTDDLLVTAFSTPKQIVLHQKKSCFLDPMQLRADADTVMSLLENVSATELVHLLKNRSIISGPGITPRDDVYRPMTETHKKKDKEEKIQNL